jgi:branched-chain amino acid transport system permease protein
MFAIALSEWTKAWQFYLGVFFVLMVMYAPGGVASLILMNLRVAKYKLFGRLRDPYVGVLLTGLVLLVGIILVVEMSYHLTLNFAAGSRTKIFGFEADGADPAFWVLAFGILAAGAVSFEAMRRYFAREWGAVQEKIEDQIQREQRV